MTLEPHTLLVLRCICPKPPLIKSCGRHCVEIFRAHETTISIFSQPCMLAYVLIPSWILVCPVNLSPHKQISQKLPAQTASPDR